MSREGIKVLFKLPLRQTTGMVVSLLKLADLDWAVPDYTTLCRRQKTLAVQIPYRRADGPLNLLVDSTGIKFLGDGEWHARKHGVQGRRQSLPGSACPKRDLARHPALRSGRLEALDRIPCPQPDRSEPSHGLKTNHCRAMDARLESIRGTHRRTRPGPPDRRNPHPHRTHEPLQRPRNGRDRSRRLMLTGKGLSCHVHELRNNAYRVHRYAKQNFI